MMKFRTMYDDFERIYSNPGSPEEPIYSPVVDDNGCISLEVVGTMDIASYIDSFRESCDLNVILSRYANGDVTALSQRQGTFFDATGMPSTYAEMLQTVITAETEFNKLPLAVRERFDNSFHKWLSLMDRPDEFNRLMSLNDDKPDPEPKPESGDANV